MDSEPKGVRNNQIRAIFSNHMFTPFIIVLSACRTNDSPNNPLELHGRWIALVWLAVQSASPKM